MSSGRLSCVLLADRHHGVNEAVRGMLDSMFETVVMVADAGSLIESARRLDPEMVVVDLSLKRNASLDWLRQLRKEHPDLPVIVLSVHDEPSVCQAALAAGASRLLLKRTIATDLLSAIEALWAGTTKEHH